MRLIVYAVIYAEKLRHFKIMLPVVKCNFTYLYHIKTLSFLSQLYIKGDKESFKIKLQIIEFNCNCNILDLNNRYEIYNINR